MKVMKTLKIAALGIFTASIVWSAAPDSNIVWSASNDIDSREHILVDESNIVWTASREHILVDESNIVWTASDENGDNYSSWAG